MPDNPNLAICSLEPGAVVHGHVNWTLAEFSGALAWAGIAFDADYNFALVPQDSHGLTRASETLSSGQQYIEAEFASSETGDRFKSNWWANFRDAVESHDDSAVQALITPSSGNLAQTVVQGLFGMDCEHDCHSEVHPVYALAIEVEDKGDDNTWAIFVRNSGNEGFCSKFDHQLLLPGNQLNLFLPRLSAGTPEVLSSTDFQVSVNTIQFPEIKHVSGQGTSLTFSLPDPGEHPLVELILHLKWSGDTYTGPPLSIHVPQHIPALLEAHEAKSPETARDAEEYLEILSKNNQSNIKKRPRPALPKPAPHYVFPEGRTPQVVEVPHAPLNLKLAATTRIPTRLVVDKNKRKNDLCPILLACDANKEHLPNRVPQLPEICAKLKGNECDALAGK